MKARRKDFDEFTKLFNDTILRFGDSLVSTASFTAGTGPSGEVTAAITIASDNSFVTLVSFGSGVFFNKLLAIHVVLVDIDDGMMRRVHCVGVYYFLV